MVSTAPAAIGELAALRQWVVWKWEERAGRKTKVPYQTGGRRAAVDDPSTWTSYEAACAAQGFAGVGFVLSDSDPFVAWDLDASYDPATGGISANARIVVDRMASFTYITPSGNGLRVLCRGQLPPGRRTDNRRHLECYDEGRFVTITDRHLPGTPDAIEERQAELEALHAELFPAEAHRRTTPLPPVPIALDDQTLLERAFAARNGPNVERLYRGDWGAYGSQSEADLALCDHLAYWLGRDASRVDRVFRSSGLFRDKWDRPYADGTTYGERTTALALAGTEKTYDPTPRVERINSSHSFLSFPSQTAVNGINSSTSFLSSPTLAPSWPKPLAVEAFLGLAGAVVRTLEPHTEADPAALLINFLVAYGNALGRGAYAVAEADRHGTNLFAVLVGESAKGRKGSSWGHIRELFRRVDPTWSAGCVTSGLASGEGMIWEVRDPIEKTDKHGDPEIVDAGVSDKRRLIVEGEYASVLKVLSREGNTLSTVVRLAWDTGDLSTLTKNNPGRATGAHFSIIGHVTRDELLRYLNDTEAGNGFANRYLWVCTRRSKVLPEGGGIVNYQALTSSLALSLFRERERGEREIKRDEEARAMWADVYGDLSEGRPGLLGSVTGRAEAQVLRLSVLYAAIDGAEYVGREHLLAALAVWEYVEASARYVFGDSLGDPVADALLGALRRDGVLPKTKLHDLFGRNYPVGRIETALGLLERFGLAQRTKDEKPGPGRPAELWTAS